MTTPKDIPIDALYRGYATTHRLKALQEKAAKTLGQLQSALYSKALVSFFEQESLSATEAQQQRISIFLDAFKTLPASFEDKVVWIEYIKQEKYSIAKFKYPGYSHDFFTSKAAHLRQSLTVFGEKLQFETERLLVEEKPGTVADLPQTDTMSP
jgi:hypothetical protein